MFHVNPTDRSELWVLKFKIIILQAYENKVYTLSFFSSFDATYQE